MKEIKFRAWLECAKKMFKVENIFFKDKMVMLDKNYELGCCRDFDDVDLMQFTGLRDKNGKEIYEGDIVRLGNYGYYAVVKWSKSDVSFVLYEPIDQFYNWFSDYAINDPEVIGNIYENPELLEV